MITQKCATVILNISSDYEWVRFETGSETTYKIPIACPSRNLMLSSVSPL